MFSEIVEVSGWDGSSTVPTPTMGVLHLVNIVEVLRGNATAAVFFTVAVTRASI